MSHMLENSLAHFFYRTPVHCLLQALCFVRMVCVDLGTRQEMERMLYALDNVVYITVATNIVEYILHKIIEVRLCFHCRNHVRQSIRS